MPPYLTSGGIFKLSTRNNYISVTAISLRGDTTIDGKTASSNISCFIPYQEIN